MIQYTAPTAEDLNDLKTELGLSSAKMAELASVSAGNQWRKYTSGAEPRDLNMHMLFFIAARLALTPDELERVTKKMRQIGASVEDIPPVNS